MHYTSTCSYFLQKVEDKFKMYTLCDDHNPAAINWENKAWCLTCIHNWPLQPFSQDYGLASHTTHVVCVNFIHQWQFNVDSERQIFEKLFHDRFIYSQSFCLKSAERKSPKKYFFPYFILMTDLGYGPRFLRLISRHTTYRPRRKKKGL